MKRRKFLQFLGVGTAVAAVPTIGFASTDFKEAVISLIERDLDYLNLDRKGLEQYVEEAFSNETQKNKIKIQFLNAFRMSSKNSYTIEKITRQYLMGSDFFRNKMDESKIVRYTGLYDPYRFPCSHPFNHLNYPESLS